LRNRTVEERYRAPRVFGGDQQEAFANEGRLTGRTRKEGSATILLFILERHSGLDMPEARRELHASPGEADRARSDLLGPGPDFTNF